MKATDFPYTVRNWDQCCKRNQPRNWDAPSKLYGTSSAIATLSLTEMKTPKGCLNCAKDWPSYKNQMQFSKIVWLNSSVCINAVLETSTFHIITLFLQWTLPILMLSASVSNAFNVLCLFDNSDRKVFKFDPNLYPFKDENAQFVWKVHL